MKKYNSQRISIFFALGLLFFTTSCTDFLKEEVYTQYDPNTFLQDQAGIDALLNGAYSRTTITGYDMRDFYMILNELPTDITRETGGGLNAQVVPIMQFTWDPSMNFFKGRYNRFYSAIAKINGVILVAESVDDEEIQNKIYAEARFLRAMSYYSLHNLFGPTPIIEIPAGASVDEIEKIGQETPRATEEAYRKYVEDDLLFSIEHLAIEGPSSRATKGSALALLAKFYLNTKQWDKAATTAQEVLNLNYYNLYEDYTTLFALAGEGNNEFIYRFECQVGGGSPQSNNIMAHTLPPNYPAPSNWSNYGADFKTYTAFYDTFEENDVRRSLFLTEYTPKNSTEVVPLVRDAAGNPLNNLMSFKYTPDPDAIGESHGNDVPYIRLADIMLTRAEALNELNGPTQESIDLINEIRLRAKASTIQLGDFATKESLRDFILTERAREFYTEGLRREDLIRHGKFIQQALDRGIVNAKPFHVLYPLPQDQIDNNPNLEQNEGYN